MDVWVVYGCDRECGGAAKLYGVYEKEEDARKRSREESRWYLNVHVSKVKVN